MISKILYKITCQYLTSCTKLFFSHPHNLRFDEAKAECLFSLREAQPLLCLSKDFSRKFKVIVEGKTDAKENGRMGEAIPNFIYIFIGI